MRAGVGGAGAWRERRSLVRTSSWAKSALQPCVCRAAKRVCLGVPRQFFAVVRTVGDLENASPGSLCLWWHTPERGALF